MSTLTSKHVVCVSKTDRVHNLVSHVSESLDRQDYMIVREWEDSMVNGGTKLNLHQEEGDMNWVNQDTLSFSKELTGQRLPLRQFFRFCAQNWSVWTLSTFTVERSLVLLSSSFDRNFLHSLHRIIEVMGGDWPENSTKTGLWSLEGCVVWFNAVRVSLYTQGFHYETFGQTLGNFGSELFIQTMLSRISSDLYFPLWHFPTFQALSRLFTRRDLAIRLSREKAAL